MGWADPGTSDMMGDVINTSNMMGDVINTSNMMGDVINTSNMMGDVINIVRNTSQGESIRGGGGGCIRGSWILEFRFLGCQILDLWFFLS